MLLATLTLFLAAPSPAPPARTFSFRYAVEVSAIYDKSSDRNGRVLRDLRPQAHRHALGILEFRSRVWPLASTALLAAPTAFAADADGDGIPNPCDALPCDGAAAAAVSP